MIDVGMIRAAARATDGDVVGMSKAQLDELLDEVERGHVARRRLQLLDPGNDDAPAVGIDGVSDAKAAA